jgi:N-acetylmuramoyl-L-alanine amidase
MKFGIDIGHNCPPDTGATGIEQEDKLTLAVGEVVINNLKSAGHTVVECKPNKATSLNDSLHQRVAKANSSNVDFFVSIHFNAINKKANGSEVYALSKAGNEVANRVLQEIVALGFKNRGVKSANFFVLTNTQMPSILIECCFCDSSVDMEKFNAKAMGDAISRGLLGKAKQDDKPDILVIKVPTLLKPSTEQAANLAKDSCIEIAPGEYPIIDAHLEEGHYRVEWPNILQGNRREHFVFAKHCEIK